MPEMSYCKPVYRSAPQSAALRSRGSDRQLTTCPKHILLTGAPYSRSPSALVPKETE
ncbi:hypothetical protein AGR7C_pAt0165 [Agrobacterium deltaense Zutra 3/1]|uniref:Uncharacterized protein n=1 Tax=Agrobacterium deltaense Zutra 3/1 TaxID=1183427 RepID=A0A1S7S3G8_9HYPH|nr:hypothetical protein AGR7C_pAt0165 [Agrobacterium deltaense Zutra 3/1]